MERRWGIDERLHFLRLETNDKRELVVLTAQYDVFGRLETMNSSIYGSTRPMERRKYDIDGQVIVTQQWNLNLNCLQLTQLNIGEQEKQRWTLHYDLDGRLKAFNEKKVQLANGGAPVKMGQVERSEDEKEPLTGRILN